MLINSKFVTFFKRTVVTPTDFCLSNFPQHQHVQSNLLAKHGGTNSSYFDFNFSHDLKIGTSSDLDFQHDLIIETSREVIDNFLEDLERLYINKEVDFCNSDLEDFYDLIFMFKNKDVQIKRPKFKRLKNNIL